MASRLELHEELCGILGSRHAYFQPPSNLKMTYPCIRYSCDGYDTKYANNKVYSCTRRYNGIVIDKNPDSVIAETILKHFQLCSLGSSYVSDNLNHFPFTLYY